MPGEARQDPPIPLGIESNCPNLCPFMSSNSSVLELLNRDELLGVVDRFNLPVTDRRRKDGLLDAVAASKGTTLAEILSALPRDRLKRMCRTFDLDDSGREKAALINRLLNSSEGKEARPASPPSVSVAPSPRPESNRNGNRTPRTRPMFEQAFKNIDDVLWKEAGCASELDYTEQTSWLLFLKYLDGLEQDRADEAELEGKRYDFILEKAYRWEAWAAPKDPSGKLDLHAAKTGPDLTEFVNGKLFPYLQGFRQKATGPNTIEYKIGEIFGEIKNKISSGYNLREIADVVDTLRFRSQAEKHELSHLYEAKIRNMGNAGRNGGEYYTPRPLIRAIIRVVQPKVGERIYDGAAGSAGFLCEAFDYMKARPGLTTKDAKTLQERTFYGKEKKSLAYVIAIMNMILHGIDAPNIIHTNTLSENISDIQDRDRYDVVLANPPFGGKERKEVQQNFPIRSGETAFLFLQHFIKSLKAGGRGGIVIKNTFLSNEDNAAKSLRKLLLESCNLHTVLDCPSGTFQGAGVKTVVLFFQKGSPTQKVWFYQLDPGRTLGKTTPLNDDDLKEFVTLQETFADSPKSWSVEVAGLDRTTFDLIVKNPSGRKVVVHRSPEDILDEIACLDAESAEALKTIRSLL